MSIEVKKGLSEKQEAIDNSRKEQKELSTETLQAINNNDFLKISPENRLQYITKNNIKSEDLTKKDLRISSLEFTFTFDGKFNKELYLKTTAGQALPNEVREVQSEGITYSRTGLKGEFFAGGGRRLVIHEGTKIDKIKVGTQEEMKKLETEAEKKTNEFIENNPGTEIYKDIVSEAFKRDIDPKFAVLAFGERVKDLPMVSIDRAPIIEDMFTEYDRVKGNLPGVINNSGDGLEILLLRQFGGKNWKQKAEKLGISNDTIKQFETSSYGNLDINNLPKGIKGLLKFVSYTENHGINYEAIFAREKGNQAFDKPLSEMTVNEVINNQINYKRKYGYKSAAIGAYQFMDYTLKDMINKGIINGNDKFTPEFQDEIALIKIKQRGLDSFMSGQLSKEQFAHNLSKEWASLPDPYKGGKSFYSGDGLNKSLTTWDNFSKVLDNTIV